jgi:hypothetical protein
VVVARPTFVRQLLRMLMIGDGQVTTTRHRRGAGVSGVAVFSFRSLNAFATPSQERRSQHAHGDRSK